MAKNSFDFDALVASTRQVHEHVAAQVGKAVNISLTLRNWVIGAYIAEYELHGKDRADYGQNLLAQLADRLRRLNVSTCEKGVSIFICASITPIPRLSGQRPHNCNPLFRRRLRLCARKCGQRPHNWLLSPMS